MSDRSGSNIIFLDKSFSKENSRSYILSIQLSAFRFSCVVYSETANNYIGFVSGKFSEKQSDENLINELDYIIKEIEWLNYPYKKVYFIIQNHFSTLIPQALFDKSESNAYLEFNQPIDDGSIINYDTLKNTSSVNVFSLSDQLSKAISSRFQKAAIKHFASIFIEAIAINFKNQMDDKSVYLNVRRDYFDLLHFKENKLAFYNLFKYKTKEDFIYFLLAALEQLSLNPEEVHINLMGEIDHGDRLYEMIYRYVRHSQLIGRNETYRYAHALDEVKHPHFFVLYNLLQCVS